MFQVLLQHFEDRFARFCVDEPLKHYQVLDRMKKLYCFFQSVYNQQIVTSYKDLFLCKHLLVSILTGTSVYVSEAFSNASPCGSDIYQGVYLKVRESDSPFLLKRSSDSKEASAESMSTKQCKSLLSSFSSSVNCERSVVADACDWKTSK